MTIPDSVYASLPAAFVTWYRQTFTGERMIYGHWSMGPYTRAVGSYHRQIAVLAPLALDEMLDRLREVRNRRIGGAINAMWNQVEEMKREATIQVFESAPFDRDLPDHTPGRDIGSVSIAIMCAAGARPNDLGHVEPLPQQLRALVGLVAEACDHLGAPVERFMSHSEAADNLDRADPSQPTAPYGFRTTREVWDLEAWIEPETEVLSPPMASARPGWVRLADWVRAEALRALVERTRPRWQA